MADLTNLPVKQLWTVGRGTSDDPTVQLYDGETTPPVPKSSSGLSVIVLVVDDEDALADNIDPLTNPHVLIYLTIGAGITEIDEPNGLLQISILPTHTYDPDNPTVAARFDDLQPYPFVVRVSNGVKQRVIARGSFVVEDIA